MNLRSILNGIAALAALGAFYTFAFCMVDDVNDAEISQEFYYNTATDTIAETEETTAPFEMIMASVNKITERTYNKERPDMPQTNDILRINSKMEDLKEYMASPETENSVVITPIFSGEPEDEEETTVTSVPVSEDTEGSATESAGADIQTEAVPEEQEYYEEDVPEDTDDDLMTFEADVPEATDVSQSYMEALHFSETQINSSEEDIRKKMEEIERAFTEQQTSIQTSLTESTTTASNSIVFPETYYETVPSFTEATTSESIVEISPSGGEIFTAKVDGTVQEFDAYELVCMIVSTEMSPSFSPEALKAQAVAAYSYVKYHNVKGIVPSVLVKRDIPQEVTDAVNAVWGKCCYYNGMPAQTVYTASTAGTTASGISVWGGTDLPYLTCVATPFDAEFDPNYGLLSTYSEEYMRSAIESALGITLSDDPANWLVITSRVDGNYVEEVTVDGQVSVSGKRVREKIMKYGIKSWCFDVSYADGEFTFVTYGYGHGAGMSQNGANYLGKQGYTYDQILAYYFPGITIE